MRKIRVVFYVHEWTYAGTARSHFRILEAIDRSKFEPYALYWPSGQNDLLPELRRVLGSNLIPFDRSAEKTGPEKGYSPIETDFCHVIERIQPDIFHHARGGYYEFPLSTHRHARLQVETNIFGEIDHSRYLDRTISICNYIAERRGKSDCTIYNPIPPAELEGPNLRAELGIPEDAIVCGRIGRPAGWDPIAVEAFAKILRDIPNMYYLIVAPPAEMVIPLHAANNIRTFPPTVDDGWIAKFHRTLDIFCHFRSDGECHSTAISQAMMYGIPVISHTSPYFNGQKETIQDGGAVWSTVDEYANQLRIWIREPEIRKARAQKAKEWAEANFLQTKVVRQIEDKYLAWLK